MLWYTLSPFLTKYLCDVMTTDCPFPNALVRQFHTWRLATGSKPLVGSSCKKKTHLLYIQYNLFASAIFWLHAWTICGLQYCGINNVLGGSMDFMGHPCPQIYNPINFSEDMIWHEKCNDQNYMKSHKIVVMLQHWPPTN